MLTKITIGIVTDRVASVATCLFLCIAWDAAILVLHSQILYTPLVLGFKNGFPFVTEYAKLIIFQQMNQVGKVEAFLCI